ncbi:MAG: hypothetical protein ACRES3_05420 [Steroidobacteraceae bacterium]
MTAVMPERRWAVHKFGGSSLADADCLRRFAAIVEALPESRVALVLSACRGVTDELIELVGVAERADEAGCEAVFSRLHQRHAAIATELLDPPAREAFERQLLADIADLRRITHTVALVRSAGCDLHDLAAGFGELWSSRLFAAFLENRAWIDHTRRNAGPVECDAEEGRRIPLARREQLGERAGFG